MKAVRSPLALVAAGIAAVAIYLWDDLFWAAPILVMSKRNGAWMAFGVFSLLYGLGSFVVGLLVVRVYDRWSQGRPSRLAKWLSRQEMQERTVWSRRMLTSGKASGFVLCSWALGGIMTTWLLAYSGRREGIVRLCALSSAIFGVTFAGFYAGIFGLFRHF